MDKDLNYYLKLPYTIILEERNDGNAPYVAARVKELPGCLSHGDTIEAAVHDIQDAKREWLESNLEDGLPIPEPQEFSGQYHLRIPPALHRQLASLADEQRISLNQYMLMALSRVVGKDEGQKAKLQKARAR